MAQTSISSRFCTRCGTAITMSQNICSVCNTKLDYRYTQSAKDDACSPDATQKLPSHDPDATVRADFRLPSSFYAQASRQQEILRSAVSANHTSLSLPTDTTPPQPERKFLRQPILRLVCGAFLALLLFFIGSSIFMYNGQSASQKKAIQQKAQLDYLVNQALLDGVPLSAFRALLDEEAQEDASPLFLSYLPEQIREGVYQSQIRQYRSLQRQVPQIAMLTTMQLKMQTQRDLQDFQIALSQHNLRPVGNVRYFSQQFSQDQLLLASAQKARDYSALSKGAKNSVAAIHLMETTFKHLTDFRDTLARMQAAHIDVTAMQAQYQDDVQAFNSATQSIDFINVDARLNAQYQQLVVGSVQSFPYVSISRLNVLTAQIETLRSYNLDASPYQQRLRLDQVARENAHTISDMLHFFQQVDADIASMNNDLVLGQARSAVDQFHHEVDEWVRSHPYYNSFDGHDYALNNGYMQHGIGATLDEDLKNAHTFTTLQTVALEAQNALFSLHAFEANYNNRSSYNQMHSSDLLLLNHYQLQKKQVLLISLAEQAMRVYQSGSLVRSLQVTTGRQALPSLPGVWSVLDRRSPVVFKSGEPKDSPYWFPDTPINYAILYHYGGYFVHDAPWRSTFGPGSQFPHQDAGGNTSYNFDGSHGCVNLPTNDAAWIYQHTDWSTVIVIY